MSTADKRVRWQVSEPEAAAYRVAGRPVQALWTLLAPTFRDVLLAPRRRADGDQIVWEWRTTGGPSRPGADELRELRQRLRDAVEVFAAEAARRPVLPEGLTAGELGDGVARALINLTNGADASLAEHAVRVEAGWMLRSWGYSRPSPAVSTDDAPEPRDDGAAKRAGAEAGAAPAGSGAGRRAGGRAWLWGVTALVIVAGAAGLWTCSRNERSRGVETTAAAEDTAAAKAPEREQPRPEKKTPEPARPAKIEAGAAAAPARSPASVGGVVATATAALSPSQATTGPSSRMPAESDDAVSVPMAITGPVASMPAATEAKAGPRSRVAGHDDPTMRVTTVRGGKGEAEALPVSRAERSGGPEAVVKNDGAEASKDADAIPAGASSSATKLVREERRADPAPEPPPPMDSAVEARAAPPPQDEPAPLPAEETKRAANPRPKIAEVEDSATAPAPSPSDAAGEKLSRSSKSSADEPGLGVGAPQGSAKTPPRAAADAREPSSRASGVIAERATTLRLQAAPWRLMFERDAMVPTRPYAGDGVAELREARIEAWAKARASTPVIFSRRDARSGWVFAPTRTDARGTLTWRVATAAAGAGGETSASADVLRISWAEDEKRELDARLVDETGRILAKVKRLPAENRLIVEIVAAEIEARPWFSWQGGAATVTADGVNTPAGWRLQVVGDRAELTGPAGATRVRLGHAQSGWALHGGYLPAPP